jgi:hypothetical protein
MGLLVTSQFHFHSVYSKSVPTTYFSFQSKMREGGRWPPRISFTRVEFQWKILFFLRRTCAVRLRVIMVSRSELAWVFAFSFHHRISLLFSSWIGCSIRFPLRACAVCISSLICCWRLFFCQFHVRWVLPHSHNGIRPGHHLGFVIPPVFFLGCFSLLSARLVGVPAGSDFRTRVLGSECKVTCVQFFFSSRFSAACLLFVVFTH